MELLLCKECKKYYIEKEKGIIEKIKNRFYNLGGRIVISLAWAFLINPENREELYGFFKKHAGRYDKWCPRCIKKGMPAFALELSRIIDKKPSIKKA